LEAAEEYLKERLDELGTQDKEYIEASIALSAREIERERERLQRRVVVSLALSGGFRAGYGSGVAME